MDYKKYNDYELIYMVRENDEDSKSLLYRKYQPILCSLTNKYYRKYKDKGYQYDDFYQEAVLSFYKALDSFDSSKEALFYTYVTICVERNLLSYDRKIANNIRKNSLDEYIQLDEVSYKVEDPRERIDEKYDIKEIESIIKEVIYSYSIEISSMLELKFNGFTYKEIGKLLDVSPRSVEFKIRRPRRLLRSKLRKYYCK